MIDWLDQPLTTMTFCWRLERRDGVAIGFTSHDRDLVRGGMTYRSAPGMAPSAIERSARVDDRAIELTGALTSDAITVADLSAGRWDGARLWLWAADWSDDAAPPVLLARGTLGAVSVRGAQFTAALDGPLAALDRPLAGTVAPGCAARLGDPDCRVDLAGRRHRARVVAVDRDVVTLAAAAPDGLVAGTLRWLDGPNATTAHAVLAADGTTLTLADPPPQMAGGTVELTEGCDRRFSTCTARFANAANFRGHPHVPGNDLLTRHG